jgi:acyl carrier protein
MNGGAPTVRERIYECLYAAIDEVNRDRDGKPPLAKAPETPIHGDESALDSLGLVNFVVAAEENIEQEFGLMLMLADDRSLSQEPSPFRSVQALADYVLVLLAEAM